MWLHACYYQLHFCCLCRVNTCSCGTLCMMTWSLLVNTSHRIILLVHATTVTALLLSIVGFKRSQLYHKDKRTLHTLQLAWPCSQGSLTMPVPVAMRSRSWADFFGGLRTACHACHNPWWLENFEIDRTISYKVEFKFLLACWLSGAHNCIGITLCAHLVLVCAKYWICCQVL